MAGGKQTPRQKMIGLMYLVFISLMALNVSVTVMDSFILIDEGIKETNEHFTKRIDDIMRDFEFQDSIAPDRVGPFFESAQKIENLSSDLVDTILFFRTDMLAKLDGISMERADTMSLRELRTRSQYSASSRYWLIEGNQDPVTTGGRGSRAHTLKIMLEEYRESVTDLAVELVPETNREEFLKNFDLGINIEGPFYDMSGNEVSWQRGMFDRVIPIAIATNLSRLVTEVRNATLEATSKLYALIDAETFRFDRIEAKVIPRSRIVLQGDAYEADVLVAAYDSQQNPIIVVDGRPIEVRDGIGKLRLPATAVGTRRISGEIRVPDPATGITRNFPFQEEYTVQPQAVTVSADGMNVFFVGIDNPVSISVPGIASEQVRASMTSGSLISRGGGTFTARIPEGTTGEVRVNVSAMIDGTPRNVGTRTFRIGRVPNPVAMIAGYRSGDEATTARLTSRPRLAAVLEDFYFDLSYEIASFEFAFTDRTGDTRRIPVRGANLPQEAMNIIQAAPRGSQITFDNVIARGPDGDRPIAGIFVRIR